MSALELIAATGGLLVGAGSAAVLLRYVTLAPDPRLVRTNVAGRAVPAVLGAPLILGGLNGLFVGTLVLEVSDSAHDGVAIGLAVAAVLIGPGLGGYADDLRGDEASRGFGGHLRAAVGGRMTGGTIKIVAVGLAGVAAALAMRSSFLFVVECVLLVALSANLLNLLDRAPGRAGKVGLVACAGLVFAAGDAWVVASAGTVGALVVCLPPDLRERAMLGDAGANPVGALIGLGLATTPAAARVTAIVVLVLLNLASEIWSFSTVIAHSRLLNGLDRVGRRDPAAK